MRTLKKILLILLLLGAAVILPGKAFSQDAVPDTVRTGVYITSIHDIDFKQKEFAVNLWLWLKYKNKEFDFMQNLEVPGAKSVSRSFSTIDSSNGEIYLLMKLQCIMKDSWKIDNFPFDKQKLRFSIENSQFDSKALVFAADTLGKHFDPRFTLRGWTVHKLDISTGIKAYETTFGDSELQTPHTEYSSFKVRMEIDREAMGLFWKMFLGMFVAFLIAFMCFFIHIDGIDSRFSLSVGALFGVIGNKYIIDSALPESTTFTLVDTLHGITLIFILAVIVCNTYVLKLVKQDRVVAVDRFDKMAAIIVFCLYAALNVYFIALAAKS